MTHHPTWEEVREEYLRDPEVRAAYDEGYAPVVRDRAAERARCEATVPGYAEARAASAAP